MYFQENSAGDPGRLIKDSVSELDFTVDENMSTDDVLKLILEKIGG